MIKLSDVSIEEVGAWYSAPKLQKIFEERNIRTIQDLLDEKERDPELRLGQIIEKLEKKIKHVERCNAKGWEPVVFKTKEYEDSTLEHTDTLNNGDVLLLSNPTAQTTLNLRSLDKKSLDQIKNELSHCIANGNNYLISTTRDLGPGAIQKVIEAVDLYTDQVIRQSMLTDSRDINLFTFQQSEKLEAVNDLYEKIITYFIYHSKEFIWGELSEPQKKLYLSSIIHNGEFDRIIRERMVANISNYTTLKELEDVDKGNYKPLQRFIKR